MGSVVDNKFKVNCNIESNNINSIHLNCNEKTNYSTDVILSSNYSTVMCNILSHGIAAITDSLYRKCKLTMENINKNKYFLNSNTEKNLISSLHTVYYPPAFSTNVSRNKHIDTMLQVTSNENIFAKTAYITEFILQILYEGNFCISAFVASLIYISRLQQYCQNNILTIETWSNIFFQSLLFGDKIVQDQTLSMIQAVKLFPFMNIENAQKLQRIYAQCINYRFHITQEQFCKAINTILQYPVSSQINSIVCNSKFYHSKQKEKQVMWVIDYCPFIVLDNTEKDTFFPSISLEYTINNMLSYSTNSKGSDEQKETELLQHMDKIIDNNNNSLLHKDVVVPDIVVSKKLDVKNASSTQNIKEKTEQQNLNSTVITKNKTNEYISQLSTYTENTFLSNSVNNDIIQNGVSYTINKKKLNLYQNKERKTSYTSRIQTSIATQWKKLTRLHVKRYNIAAPVA